MRKNHIVIAAVLLALVAFCRHAYSASFDCRKASTTVEHQVCDNPSLSKLDESLSAAFKPLRNSYFIQMTQKEWLESTRDDCESIECLENAYSQQIDFLTTPPENSSFDEKNITALSAEKSYFIRDQMWRNWTLTQLSDDKKYWQRYVVTTENVSGKLHAVIFEGAFDSKMRCYKGSLYEYVDQYPIVLPILYPIAKDVCFDGSEDPDSNDEGRKLAGVLNGVFYYRVQVARDQLIGMAYTLGSRAESRESSILFQRPSDTTENEKGSLFFSRSSFHGKLEIYHPKIDKTEIIAPPNHPENDWNIYTPIWSKSRPILYFKSGESVWRANIVGKTLLKVLQAEEGGRIKSPTPVEVNGREAILYLEDNKLKVALAPDS